ncbi:MAG: Nramp family divalent metal transporter [Pseudomonadota bacterium]|nr:Nramp family divalent metal transporter [Pseudomonadota bacterium]
MKLKFGPGVLVAAAFIGPGTVTACTLAGANFGYALLWALVFATVATIILQDMSARLGAGAQLGLGEALMQTAPNPTVKWAMGGLVFAALLIGNCAYEGGNLAGGALGADALFGAASPGQPAWVAILALFAGIAVLIGRYEVLEKLLIGLVMVMSAAFLLSALFVRPDFGALLSGLRPQIPDGATLTAIALIGTTIVPYNLFLHAAASQQKWPAGHGPSEARRDSAFSIGLGGLISILILTTAASSLFKTGLEISNAADMALAIEPTFGAAARYLVGIGLFAAGLTSAITAPMATAFALSEIIGGDRNRKSKLFRGTALFVIIVGASISLLGIRPVELILIAQYANGLLLPIIAAFLLWVMNRKDLLGTYTNSVSANLVGGVIVLITLAIGVRSILRAAGWMA